MFNVPVVPERRLTTHDTLNPEVDERQQDKPGETLSGFVVLFNNYSPGNNQSTEET